jgi:two-component system chemotaxis response regulator CheY
MKYLVVDDSPTMRRIVINALKSFGIEDIIEAEDGIDGLNKMKDSKPEFIITDWNMPNMNGLEFTKAVRGNPEYASIPILMVTTRGLKQDIIEALQAKVNNYVVKPFTPLVLKEKIGAILKT